ncbi:MAG TPA: LamG domain-containing protein, partial [Verrucomicrobiota bacterium]|nr:LamG domain-containing protein [Verrucomicrobiota bacterium]
MHTPEALAQLLMFAGMTALAQVAPEPAAPDSAGSTPPLLAHWRLDETRGGVCVDESAKGHTIRIELGAGAACAPIPGLFDGAVRLSGQHRLRVEGRFDVGHLRQITLSAWVRPTAFDRYNEVFRKEDGDNRVLFSFQEHGHVLSLGLNAGGYVECDGSIDPEQVLDGRWHHCAGTFDGRSMRVYFDGHQICALERSGALTAGGPAAACLASMDGSECFQGGLDDVRIYGSALTDTEIQALFESGRPALERLARQLEERLAGLLAPGASFAETIAATRARLAGLDPSLDDETARALVRRISERHPQEASEFSRLRIMSMADFLQTRDGGSMARAGERLIGLLTEYKPLTEQQWRRQTPDALHAWKEIEVIERRFADLEAQGDAALLSAAWIELCIEAGRRIQFRPEAQEAVAPYV